MRRRIRALAVAVAVAAVVVGCDGGDDDSAQSPSPAPSESAPTTGAPPSASPKPQPHWPLTGLPAQAQTDRPALVVKVDNTSGAEPQVGLSAADLVVEELVEGGVTRLAAMFHSGRPDVVGPVRSVRTSDAGIALPAGGVLAASGGAGRVLETLDDAGVQVLTESDAGFSRASDRPAPYNVMLDPAAAAASLGAKAGRPTGPYLPWGKPPAGSPVSGADVSFSSAHTTSWSWADGYWRLQDGLAAPGDEFRPASVLVLHVTTRDAGYRDPGGNPVPETVLTGGGKATLLTGGEAVEGRWSKSNLGAPLRLATRDGQPLQVPAGRTWIELVPEGGSVSLQPR